jgi:hypothetical protein
MVRRIEALMVSKRTKPHRLALIPALLFLVCAGGVNAQDKPLEWKFPAQGMSSSVDKSSGLRFHNLEQGVRAALNEHDGSPGAVVVLPGPRLGSGERMQTAARGVDPDRMLTAMAVALVLPMPAEASQFFVAKEKLKDGLTYRWRTANGAEVCARNIPFEPFSKKHDVIFVGSCAGKGKGFVALTPENEGGTIKGYERYRPRTLSEIIREHSDPEVLQKNEGSMILTGDTFPSKVRVIYTGESRKISPAKKQHLDMLVKSFNVDQKVIDRYGTELLFKEGEDEHWLPVQADLHAFFQKELNKGEEVILYAEWVGAKKAGGKWEWVFIVQEFQK